MRFCALLLLVCLGCLYVAQALPVQAAPVQSEEVQPVSCGDASALGAAGLAVTEINKDRKEGYAFSLYRLSNVNQMTHGDTGVVFYLTLDVVETECHVLSKDWRNCEPRPTDNTPVYGQCKATIYVNRVQRVVRLYRYNCVIRPVQAVKVGDVCPDCPSYIAMDDENIQRTVKMSLEKFNKESNLTNRFALLNIARATYQGGMMEFYHVEYTIQETSCKSDAAGDCPLMTCEFAHKGFCKASLVPPHPVLGDGVENMEVDCAIYEPEAAEEQKRLHLSAGETDHTHDAAHAQDHTHDVPHSAQGHAHDHAHDHTKSQHPHDHHDHGHAHGPAHDHVHAHHAKAHNHSGDLPNQHHQYDHGDATHTHEHDHELALDHDHQHAHLHVHEHHHHHHEPKVAVHHHHPEGTVRVLPAVDRPMTLPSFPDQPAAAGPEAGVTLPLIPDPQIPGEREPTILPFPSTVSALECPGVVKANARNPVVLNAFASDPMFNAAA